MYGMRILLYGVTTLIFQHVCVSHIFSILLDNNTCVLCSPHQRESETKMKIASSSPLILAALVAPSVQGANIRGREQENSAAASAPADVVAAPASSTAAETESSATALFAASPAQAGILNGGFETGDFTDWDTIAKAVSTLSIKQQQFVCWMLHGWLPTNEYIS